MGFEISAAFYSLMQSEFLERNYRFDKKIVTSIDFFL